jgi:hypothetical protein
MFAEQKVTKRKLLTLSNATALGKHAGAWIALQRKGVKSWLVWYGLWPLNLSELLP